MMLMTIVVTMVMVVMMMMIMMMMKMMMMMLAVLIKEQLNNLSLPYIHMRIKVLPKSQNSSEVWIKCFSLFPSFIKE